jgi:CDP-diacylglycerol--glycerol-3-phosphate 3-phosphatidyltransferase
MVRWVGRGRRGGFRIAGRPGTGERRAMANAITLMRLLLLLALVAMIYRAPPAWQLLNPPLVVLVIALDAVDGYVARRRGETSLFGSLFDIAVDRVVENVLWLVLAHRQLVPVWVPILFIVRGALVDTIRYSTHGAPYDRLPSAWSRILVAGRGVRALYGTAKAATFAWLLALPAWRAEAPVWWAAWADEVQGVTMGLIGMTVGLCLVRGLPVVIDFIAAPQSWQAPHRPDGAA